MFIVLFCLFKEKMYRRFTAKKLKNVLFFAEYFKKTYNFFLNKIKFKRSYIRIFNISKLSEYNRLETGPSFSHRHILLVCSNSIRFQC